MNLSSQEQAHIYTYFVVQVRELVMKETMTCDGESRVIKLSVCLLGIDILCLVGDEKRNTCSLFGW